MAFEGRPRNRLSGSTPYGQKLDWVFASPKTSGLLQGEALMQAADKQPWDPSVKALAKFPSVLHQIAKNLACTSARAMLPKTIRMMC